MRLFFQSIRLRAPWLVGLALLALLTACSAPQPPRTEPFFGDWPQGRPYNPVPMLQRQTQTQPATVPAASTPLPPLGDISPPQVQPDPPLPQPAPGMSRRPLSAVPLSGLAPGNTQPAGPVPEPWNIGTLTPGDLDAPLLARGLASWYGKPFHGRRTASGERYDMHALTAAHKTLPLGSRVRVRSVRTGQEVVVRINDRGPYKNQRIIDLSYAAAKAIGMDDIGITEVLVLQD